MHKDLLGLIADKITPSKRTGHIMGLIVPVPENPMSESFPTPLIFGSPVVKDL